MPRRSPFCRHSFEAPVIDRQRLFRAFGAALILIALMSGCGGSHAVGTLPAVPSAAAPAADATRGTAAVHPGASADIVAINAGGAGAGSFSADADFVAHGTWTYSTSGAIDTTALPNPGPAAIYADDREGSTISYTIPGLTAGATYTVNLTFAELFFTAAGKRTFNVSINGSSMLTNFDIFATAKAKNKAIIESFTATAGSSGTIAITLGAVTNYATINALEVAPGGSSAPTPTPPATSPPAGAGSLSINTGGAAAGSFAADEDYVHAGTYTASTTNSIDTSAVTNPAPPAVYANQRVGSTISYTIGGLTAGAAYSVRLEFAEFYWTARGKRLFTIAINGTNVSTNFDIYAAAGARYEAVAQAFTATASPTGALAITLTATTNLAVINALEVTPASGGPTPTPTTAPTQAPIAFNDYSTFGYDNGRSVFNPNSTTITPATYSNLHLAWQAALGGGDFNTWTQPVLATGIAGHAGVLFAGGGSGRVYGYDATTGTLLWQRSTGQETYLCQGGNNIVFGVGGSAAYDPGSKSIYIVGNQNSAADALANNSLYHLDGASGAILGQVDFAPINSAWPGLDFSHTSVTLGSNGLAYVGTGATCDISSWRGRIAAISVPAMTLASTFFTVWDPTNSRGLGAQPWGGGGIWGWGGVSLDAGGNVYTGVGNTDNGTTANGQITAPFVKAPAEYSGFGDALIQLAPNLSRVESSNHPMPTSMFHNASTDLDLQGTPMLFQPNGVGCDPMAAMQGKSGTVYLYDQLHIGSGPVAQYQLAPSTYADGFLGGPAYSPATGLVYVGVSSSSQSLFPPGMVAINPGCGTPSIAWHAAFGPDSYSPGSLIAPGKPRSVPAVTAGGVVFVGTICTPAGSSCAATTTSSARSPQGALRKPLICCAPPGSGGGAVWALDASSGTVLNGGNPIIITSGPLRSPPTIDGNWMFVLDNSGNLYALTLDPHYTAISTTQRAVDSRMLTQWETPPKEPLPNP
jgi:hypothetical protein